MTVRSAERPVALVTGGASGIGRAAAARIAARIPVVVLDADAGGAAAVARALSAEGREVGWQELDVRDRPGCEAAVASATAGGRPLAALVHAAGTTGRDGALGDVAPDVWDHVVAVNLTGTANMVRAVLPAMVASGGGSIVLVASVAALVGWRGLAAYSASKGGIVALTRSLAADYAAEGVRVNCVCPGPTATAMTAGVATRRPLNAGGRMAEPDEVAAAIDWLASPGAAWVNGTCLPVDGAETAVHGATFLPPQQRVPRLDS